MIYDDPEEHIWKLLFAKRFPLYSIYGLSSGSKKEYIKQDQLESDSFSSLLIDQFTPIPGLAPLHGWISSHTKSTFAIFYHAKLLSSANIPPTRIFCRQSTSHDDRFHMMTFQLDPISHDGSTLNNCIQQCCTVDGSHLVQAIYPHNILSGIIIRCYCIQFPLSSENRYPLAASWLIPYDIESMNNEHYILSHADIINETYKIIFEHSSEKNIFMFSIDRSFPLVHLKTIQGSKDDIIFVCNDGSMLIQYQNQLFFMNSSDQTISIPALDFSNALASWNDVVFCDLVKSLYDRDIFCIYSANNLGILILLHSHTDSTKRYIKISLGYLQNPIRYMKCISIGTFITFATCDIYGNVILWQTTRDGRLTKKEIFHHDLSLKHNILTFYMNLDYMMIVYSNGQVYIASSISGFPIHKDTKSLWKNQNMEQLFVHVSDDGSIISFYKDGLIKIFQLARSSKKSSKSVRTTSKITLHKKDKSSKSIIDSELKEYKEELAMDERNQELNYGRYLSGLSEEELIQYAMALSLESSERDAKKRS